MEDLVKIVNIDRQEQLLYKAFPVDMVADALLAADAIGRVYRKK